MDVDGMAAVVTGGASGLGAATARALAATGVKVAIFDLQAGKGRALAEDIGGIFCAVDVTSDDSVDAGFAAARVAHGQERVLVTCVGTGNAVKTASRSKQDGSIKHFPLEALNGLVQINLVDTFRCTAKSAAGMLTLEPGDDGERGAIVNTASAAAEDGQIGQAAYLASKAGVVGMTLPIARDLMGEGIRVDTILPGIFDTPLLAAAPQPVKDALAASVPFPKRLGNPDEFAQLALTMIECGYFNGEDVRLDGAIRMASRGVAAECGAEWGSEYGIAPPSLAPARISVNRNGMARETATTQTRARLLEAASAFMRENDTLDVSLDQIARRSGLNGALVGYHFGSKIGLLRALLERDAGAALGQLEQLVAADLPPVVKMRHHLQGLIKTYARVPYLNRLAVMLLKSGEGDTAQDVTGLVRPVIDAQRRIIEQGIAAGDFRQIDPLLFYFAAISACDGLFGGRATLAALFDYDGPIEALRQLHAEQTVTLLLQGLVKQAPD